MCYPAQAGFYTAQNDRHGGFEVTADQVAVDDGGAVRPAVVFTARGVVILPAGFAQRGGVCDHRIHAASADAPKEARLAQAGDIIRAVDIRLGNNANLVTGFQQLLANQRYAVIRAVDIGVTGYQDYIQGLPA